MVLYLTESIGNVPNIQSKVIDALNKRQGIVIQYDDETSTPHTGDRYIEPYVYGLTKRYNQCIRAYQYYGDTKRGVPKWKLLLLNRIKSWEPTDEIFDLEPRARGWAAEAFNNNGDESMSRVFQIVQLGTNPQSDYERLKAKTRRLQNSKPVNINQFKASNIETALSTDEFKNRLKANKKQSGPIEPETKQQQSPIPIEPTTQVTDAGPVDGHGSTTQQSPVKQEDNSSGPIIKPKPATATEMNNDEDFQKMLQRNMEITRQEKERRFGKRQ